MSTMIPINFDDPIVAERQFVRAITDAYSLTSAWKGDGDERAEIERDIREIDEAIAFGLSKQGSKWDLITASAGVVWHLDDYGMLKVEY